MTTEEIVKDISELISDNSVSDFFIDCGQGDKFLIDGVSVSPNYRDESKKIISFHVPKCCMKWVELDGKYPIRLTTCTKRSKE